MPWKPPTLNTALEWAGIAVLAVWGIYKKEIQESLNGWGKRCYAFVFVRAVPARVSDRELDAIFGSGVRGLTTLLWLLLDEYKPDRVTVTEYAGTNGSYTATCVAEVRRGEMQSVLDMQGLPLAPDTWAEIQRIHAGADRTRYVPDAHLLDVAPLRTVLLNTGVWSAYYQSLSSTPQPQAMLSLSWHQARELSAAELSDLHHSGIACATVWQLMAQLKATSRP